jgi:hypothetical protein
VEIPEWMFDSRACGRETGWVATRRLRSPVGSTASVFGGDRTE